MYKRPGSKLFHVIKNMNLRLKLQYIPTAIIFCFIFMQLKKLRHIICTGYHTEQLVHIFLNGSNHDAQQKLAFSLICAMLELV